LHAVDQLTGARDKGFGGREIAARGGRRHQHSLGKGKKREGRPRPIQCQKPLCCKPLVDLGNGQTERKKKGEFPTKFAPSPWGLSEANFSRIYDKVLNKTEGSQKTVHQKRTALTVWGTREVKKELKPGEVNGEKQKERNPSSPTGRVQEDHNQT